jgi:predicted CopG family antitoxin
MGTKTIRLDDDVYKRVRAHKRDDETFSEAIDRLIGGASLLDLVGTVSDQEAAEMREAIERSRQAGLDREQELARRREEE